MKRALDDPDSHRVAKHQKVSHHEEKYQVVRISQIPQYLHDSTFYKSLCLENDEEIMIPANHMRIYLQLCSLSDLVELLNTIRFWILEEFLPALFSFLLNVSEDCTNILADFTCEIKYLSVFLHECLTEDNVNMARVMFNKGWTVSSDNFLQAVNRNCMHRVRYAFNVMQRTLDYPYIELYGTVESRKVLIKDLCASVVLQGYVECAKLLHKHHYPFALEKNASTSAAAEGRLNSLKCMKAVTKLRRACIPVHKAAQNGHLDCLEFLGVSGCSVDYVAMETVAAGHLNCIQYQVECGARVRTEMITEAMKHQHEDVLQFFYEHSPEVFSSSSGYDWCRQALLQNIPSCLPIFHEREHKCAWDANICRRAIQKGNFACAQYAMQHGCAFEMVETVLVVANPRLGLLTPDQSAHVAVQQDMCLQYLFQRCELQQAVHITTTASRDGNVVALRKLLQHGWPVNSSVAERAARDNDIFTLQAYCAAGHALPLSTYVIATAWGHKALLLLSTESNNHSKIIAFRYLIRFNTGPSIGQKLLSAVAGRGSLRALQHLSCKGSILSVRLPSRLQRGEPERVKYGWYSGSGEMERVKFYTKSDEL